MTKTNTNVRTIPYTVDEDAVQQALQHRPDQLTEAERAAVLAFLEQKQKADEEARLAERSHEDIYLDAFHGYIEGTLPRPHILETFAAIAAFLHDDDPEFVAEGFVDNLGNMVPETDGNNCQFNQKGFLSNLVQQAVWMHEREDRRIGYLASAAARARRAHNNGEIDTLELEAAEKNYGRCKMVNLPILSDLKTAAKLAYRCQTGEEWTAPVKKDTRATTNTLDERFAHSAKRSRL